MGGPEEVGKVAAATPGRGSQGQVRCWGPVTARPLTVNTDGNLINTYGHPPPPPRRAVSFLLLL